MKTIIVLLACMAWPNFATARSGVERNAHYHVPLGSPVTVVISDNFRLSGTLASGDEPEELGLYGYLSLRLQGESYCASLQPHNNNGNSIVNMSQRVTVGETYTCLINRGPHMAILGLPVRARGREIPVAHENPELQNTVLEPLLPNNRRIFEFYANLEVPQTRV